MSPDDPYDTGYADGHDDGYADGHDDGYADGLRKGKAAGVEEGRSLGPSVRVERLSGGLWRASLDGQPHVYEDSAVSAHDAVGRLVARIGTVTIRRAS